MASCRRACRGIASLQSRKHISAYKRQYLRVTTMSGLSTSATFLTSHEVAVPFSNVESDDWRALPKSIDKDLLLYASSRNNHMEYDLRLLIKEFQCAGLGYFRAWDEVCNPRPWIVALDGTRLADAIAGIHDFLSLLREQPGKCASLLSCGSPECEVDEALRMPMPAGFNEARDRYLQYRRGSDGDTVWCLVSFLHAHVLLLEAGRTHDLSAVYALGLY
jgi:hypothetical protein